MKIAVLIITAFIIYVIIENTLMLVTRTETLSDNLNRIKILHLSDLHKRHFGKQNSRLLKKIAVQKPDIIIFSGDLISRTSEFFENTETLMQGLTQIAPVYYSFGNHELDMRHLYPQRFDDFIKMLTHSGVHILDNKSEIFEIYDRKFKITGASLKYSMYKKEESYRNLEGITSAELIESIGTADLDFTNLLIAHNPFFPEVYAEWGADYTFSGHVHGGAVRIPFVDIPLLSPERKLFPKYSKGVFNIVKMKLLVSGGLGKLRIFNPPEIVVYYI